MIKSLRFINARLPSAPEHLYEWTAKNGIWVEQIKQEAWIENTVKSMDEMEEIIDCLGGLLLPGFVDAHMHMDKAFSLDAVKNESGTLYEAITNYSAAYPSFSVEQIKNRIRQTAYVALSKGTTYIRSHIDFQARYGREAAFRTIQAALEVREELRGLIDLQFIVMSPSRGDSPEVWEWLEEALLLGIDGVGGAPHVALDAIAHTDRIFDLAMRHGKPIDLHVDESDDPSKDTASYLAEKTMAEGYEGYVTAGHLCSLSAMDQGKANAIIQRLLTANIGAITLPGSNFYLQGREDKGLVRRGVTRIQELIQAGVPVAAASDNIQDVFHPWGNGDLLQVGLLTAYAAHWGTEQQLGQLFSMISEVPASMIGIKNYGIAPGYPATCVVTYAKSLRELFTSQPSDRKVYRNGVRVQVIH